MPAAARGILTHHSTFFGALSTPERESCVKIAPNCSAEREKRGTPSVSPSGCHLPFRAPKKDLLVKDFLGKGGADGSGAAFAFQRMPAKCVALRRGGKGFSFHITNAPPRQSRGGAHSGQDDRFQAAPQRAERRPHSPERRKMRRSMPCRMQPRRNPAARMTATMMISHFLKRKERR